MDAIFYLITTPRIIDFALFWTPLLISRHNVDLFIYWFQALHASCLYPNFHVLKVFICLYKNFHVPRAFICLYTNFHVPRAFISDNNVHWNIFWHEYHTRMRCNSQICNHLTQSLPILSLPAYTHTFNKSIHSSCEWAITLECNDTIPYSPFLWNDGWSKPGPLNHKT